MTSSIQALNDDMNEGKETGSTLNITKSFHTSENTSQARLCRLMPCLRSAIAYRLRHSGYTHRVLSPIRTLTRSPGRLYAHYTSFLAS